MTGKYRLNKDTLDIEFNDKFDGIAYGFPAFTNDKKGMERLVKHLNHLYEEKATLKKEVMEYREIKRALKIIKEII